MKDVKDIADKISFRLLATNKHPDYEWLVSYLTKQLINETLLVSWSLVIRSHIIICVTVGSVPIGL